MRVRDRGHRLELEAYPFPVASAARGPIDASRIAEILPRRFPPELWLDDGEVLFAARQDLDALVAFADRHRIPLTDREDVWALLLEDCLDTESSDAERARTREALRALGMSEADEARWRARTEARVLAYNAWVWEWVHLGHYDLLRAFQRPWSRCSRRFSALYRDSMRVAALAPRRSWDEAAFRADLEACFEPELYAAWRAVWASLGRDAPRDLYVELLAAYDAPTRRYHDRSHLAAVVRRLVERGASPEAQLAGWFHDRVDPTSRDAEERSAIAAEQALLACGVEAPTAAQVAALVRMTAFPWDRVGTDRDGRALVDADAWILGAPPARYRLYALQVRLEYGRVPWLLFRHGRMRFLRSLEARERIGFDTEPAWERQARENVAWELGEWRRFRTPTPWRAAAPKPASDEEPGDR
jgi:predicted metal-dependent HD superfamily phosphohydrolase